MNTKSLDQIGFDAWNKYCKRTRGYYAHSFTWEEASPLYKECAKVTADAIEKALRARLKKKTRTPRKPTDSKDFSAGFQRGLAQADRQWEQMLKKLKRKK